MSRFSATVVAAFLFSILVSHVVIVDARSLKFGADVSLEIPESKTGPAVPKLDHVEVSPDPELAKAAAGKGGAIQLMSISLCSLILGLVCAHEVVAGVTGQKPLSRRTAWDEASVQACRRWLQSSYLIWYVFLMMDTSVLIPTSYELAVEMGCTPATSGIFVGIGFLCATAGSMGAAFLYKRCSQPFLRALGIVGAFMLCVQNLVIALTLDSSEQHGPQTMWFMIGVRAVLGLGRIGYVVQLMAYNATPKEGRTEFSILIAMATNLGLCLGPLLSAVVIHSLGGREVVASVFSRTSAQVYIMGLLWACLAILLVFALPTDLDDLKVEKLLETPRRRSSETFRFRGEKLATQDRKAIVTHGLCFSMERSLTSSAIEAGSAMLLETQFGWGSRIVGLGISVVFGTTIVVCAVVLYFNKKNSGEVNGMVALSCISCFGALLLFDFSGFAIQILIADVLIYPCMYCANGIVDGIVTKVAVPDSWFSLETYLTTKIATQGCLRFFAFPLARFTLDLGGRNTYAGMVMLLGILGLISAMKIVTILDWKETCSHEQLSARKNDDA